MKTSNPCAFAAFAPRLLLHDDKDVLAVDHVPVAALAVPVAVFVGVPVGVVPVVTGVHRSAVRSAHRCATRTVHYFVGLSGLNCDGRCKQREAQEEGFHHTR